MTASVKACLHRVWTQARNKKAKKCEKKKNLLEIREFSSIGKRHYRKSDDARRIHRNQRNRRSIGQTFPAPSRPILLYHMTCSRGTVPNRNQSRPKENHENSASARAFADHRYHQARDR
jgi:hypothetical protein